MTTYSSAAVERLERERNELLEARDCLKAERDLCKTAMAEAIDLLDPYSLQGPLSARKTLVLALGEVG